MGSGERAWGRGWVKTHDARDVSRLFAGHRLAREAQIELEDLRNSSDVHHAALCFTNGGRRLVECFGAAGAR
jgi:hypothetical protein